MSLHLEFEPHSWYKQFAIRDRRTFDKDPSFKWEAVTANGNTGYIDTVYGTTLKELKENITAYHARIAERDAYNRRMIGETN